MKDKACFKSDTSAQIIILTGFVIAIIVVGMGTILYSAANSGQQTSLLQSDRAYNIFENIREEYGIALMVSSEKGEIDPFNVSNTTIILEFEDRMKTIVESHGFFLDFSDHEHIQLKNRAIVNILFADGIKVFNDSVTYNLLTGEIVYDTTPPGYIYDLHAETTGCFGDGFVELNWTAVGNDYYEDTSAYMYEIRYSNESIGTPAEFDNATFYRYYYDVKKNGTQQIYFVEELDPVLWHFAIRVYDKAGNFNYSNSANATASEWSPEVYNITANNETGNLTKDDPYQPNLFAKKNDMVTIQFQVRDRDNDNVTISLMVRNRTLDYTGWNYGDWFEGQKWDMGNYSDMTLSYSITEINESWDYYFNVSDNSITCPKMRSVPSGAPDDYYWIEIPYKEYGTVVLDWRFVNDTYIISDDSSNYGSTDLIKIKGTPNPIYGLIKFNLSSIPTSATIESATISLYYNTTSANSRNLSFHRVLQDWNEDNVTWNWNPTGNYSSSATISGEIINKQYYNWSVVTDVEYFHSNSFENYGWLIRVNSNQLVEFDSKEAVNASRRPVLYVTYSE
jgi:hypothetical protein